MNGNLSSANSSIVANGSAIYSSTYSFGTNVSGSVVWTATDVYVQLNTGSYSQYFGVFARVQSSRVTISSSVLNCSLSTNN